MPLRFPFSLGINSNAPVISDLLYEGNLFAQQQPDPPVAIFGYEVGGYGSLNPDNIEDISINFLGWNNFINSNRLTIASHIQGLDRIKVNGIDYPLIKINDT